MNGISRRRFLATAAMSVAATRLRAQGTAQVTLQIPAEANGPHMPADYIGLSYEVQQLLDPTFFSAKNAGLIAPIQGAERTWRAATGRKYQRVRVVEADA